MKVIGMSISLDNYQYYEIQNEKRMKFAERSLMSLKKLGRT